MTVSDGELSSDPQDITININDLNDNIPVITSSSSFSVNEGGGLGAQVATLTATDADASSTLSFVLSGTDAASFTLDSATGVLAFVGEPDYETQSSYSITLTVSDGDNEATQSITVLIINLNDSYPTITSSATFTVDENQTAIGTVTATDADGDTLTFDLYGADANSVGITSDTGVLTFVSAPDYETKSSYGFGVRVSDGENFTNQSITVSINNLNDNAPIIYNADSFSVEENASFSTQLVAADSDGTEPVLQFSLSGSDAEFFSISNVFLNDVNRYEATLSLIDPPNYESKDSYSIVLTVTDGTNSTDQAITVAVTDLNDNTPSITSSATFAVDENQTAIGTVTLMVTVIHYIASQSS